MRGKRENRVRSIPHFLAGNRDFSAFYKMCAVVCYLFLTVHFACFLSLGLHSASAIHPWIFAYYLLCALVGYWIQSLTGWIFRIQRPKAENNYEDMKRRYKPVQAIPCHIFALIWFGIANNLGFEILRKYADIFSHNSIYPLLFAVCSFMLIEFGAYLWFFPYNVLVSIRSIAIICVLILVQTVMLVYIRGLPLGMYATSLVVTEFIALLLYMVLLNQVFLTRQYDNRVSYVNDAAKLYSAGVVIGVGSVILLITFMVKTVLEPLLLFLEMIFAKGILSVKRQQSNEIENISGGGGMVGLLGGGNSAVGSGLITTILLGILFVTLFIIMISPSARERIMLFLDRLFHDLAQLFGYKEKIRKITPVEEHFTDTIENLSKRTRKHDSLPSAAAFARQLERLDTDEEKYAYAYSVYARYMEQTKNEVLISDTPRERACKVLGDDRYSDAEAYTSLFESVRYAECTHDILPGMEQKLNRLCDFLKRVL